MSLVAVEIGRHRLRAISGTRSGSTLRVQHCLAISIPDSIDREDIAAFGTWIGDELRRAGIKPGRAMVALSRDYVALKRLDLPTIEVDELPDMTRLSMQRDLPFDAESAVIDYLPLATTETTTTVLAVAAPQAVCDRSRALLENAGFKLDCLGLRALGAASLVGANDGDPRLVIDVAREAVEFTVVAGGGVRFSRSADLTPGLNGALAEAVLTETKRTWMSYRIVEGADDVAETIVLGVRDELSSTVQPLADMLQTPASLFGEHPAIESSDEAVDAVWPLAGLLLKRLNKRPTIDFTNPRRAVDRSAERRRRRMLASVLAVVLLMIAWTLARRDIANREDDLAALTSEASQLYDDDSAYVRERMRLQHIQYWESVHVDWLDHFRWLSERMPTPQELVLDGMTGSLEFRGVQWDRRNQDDPWSAPMGVELAIEGEAADRATADALRDALVRTDWLVTRSTGTDTTTGQRHPNGFTYRLRTEETAPPEEVTP